MQIVCLLNLYICLNEKAVRGLPCVTTASLSALFFFLSGHMLPEQFNLKQRFHRLIIVQQRDFIQEQMVAHFRSLSLPTGY